MLKYFVVKLRYSSRQDKYKTVKIGVDMELKGMPFIVFERGEYESLST